MPLDSTVISTVDFEYLVHDRGPLTLRLFRPAGEGAFPVVIDIHGGAWNTGDLTDGEARDRSLAEAGIAVAAIDFRHAADARIRNSRVLPSRSSPSTGSRLMRS